jgi:hypothetical protein
LRTQAPPDSAPADDVQEMAQSQIQIDRRDARIFKPADIRIGHMLASC